VIEPLVLDCQRSNQQVVAFSKEDCGKPFHSRL